MAAKSEANVPDGWQRVRLGDVAKLGSGKTPRYDNECGIVPVLGSNGPIGLTKESNFSYGIAVGRVGASGSVQRIKEAVWLSDNVLFVDPSEAGLDLSFLCNVLQIANLPGLASKTAQPLLTQGELSAVQILLPPLPEQRAIAAVLDSIDDAIEGAEVVIAATGQLRDSLLHDFLTRGLPGQHTEFRDVPGLGAIPADWEMVRLGDVGSWHSGGTPPKANQDYWEGPIPWVSPKDMKVREINGSADSISEEAAEAGSRIMPAGSILIVVRGMILAHSLPVAITGVSCAFNQDIRALIPDKKFDSQYVIAALESEKAKMLDLVTPSTHGTMRIVSEDLLDIRIPFPSIMEQEAIAAALDVVDATLEVAQEELAGLRLLRESTADALLTGQVRVGIGIRR